jgi:ribonucleoside-triphosphate reductase (thioredoxin)
MRVANVRELTVLRDYAVEVNKVWAKKLGINQSAAITCVKPSGNTSVLVDCSSGIHARWAEYYIRNVRVMASSPLAKVLKDSGYELSPENGQDPNNPTTWVVSFPVKSPKNAQTRKEWDALNQFGMWLRNKMGWTEHNPSVTIQYTDDEVLELMGYMYEEREYLGGLTILPRDDADYAQLPYIEITKEEYKERVANLKPIQMERLYLYEKDDMTTATQEVACVTGLCEL